MDGDLLKLISSTVKEHLPKGVVVDGIWKDLTHYLLKTMNPKELNK